MGRLKTGVGLISDAVKKCRAFLGCFFFIFFFMILSCESE